MRSYQRRVCMDSPHFSAVSRVVQPDTSSTLDVRARSNANGLSGPATASGGHSALPAFGAVRLGGTLQEQEVAPEGEPPYLGAGKCRGRVLTDLAGGQRRLKNLWHRRVTPLQPLPAVTVWSPQNGEGGAEYPVTDRSEQLGRQLE